MQAASHLLRVIYRPRVFAYLLAVVILAQLDDLEITIYAWMLGLLIYPHLLQWSLSRFARHSNDIRISMFVDAVLVGLLVSLVDFNLEASVVLISLLAISVLLVGGIGLLLKVLPLLGLGIAVGPGLHGGGFVGGSSFYLLSFVSLLAYIMYIGSLVYQETRQLSVKHRQEYELRHSLEQFRSLLSPYLGPHHRENGNSVARRKRLTVFFSDIEGFTQLMDSEDESMVADMLNSYFASMATIANKYGGTLDKFIGDGVMIFFGDPQSRGPEEDALACVAMALEMRERFDQISRSWQSRTQNEPLHLRIGIHTGFCLVGDFGSSERKDYTAIGSTVNQASRLEGSACRDEILISEETYKLVQRHICALHRGDIPLKGLARPVCVYSVSSMGDFSEGNVRLLG